MKYGTRNTFSSLTLGRSPYVDLKKKSLKRLRIDSRKYEAEPLNCQRLNSCVNSLKGGDSEIIRIDFCFSLSL